MENIIDLLEEMDEEIEGAKKYAKMAVKCAEMKHSSCASTYSSMAEQELDHYEKLHNMVVDHIHNMKEDESGEAKAVKAMYEYHHKGQVKEIAHVRYILSQAKKSF